MYYVYIRCVHDGLDFYSDEGTTRRPSHFHLCNHSMIKAFEFSMYNRVALDFLVPHRALHSHTTHFCART